MAAKRLAARYVARLGCDVRLVKTDTGSFEIRVRDQAPQTFYDRSGAYAAYDAIIAEEQ